MLLCEARTSLTQIAKKCKISVPSVNARIKQLKKKEIINGAIMQINPQKIGFTCCGVLDIETLPENKEKIRKYLNDKHLNFYDYQYFGNTTITAYITLKQIRDLARTIENIKANCNILDIKTAIFSNLTKLDTPENLILSTFNNLEKNLEVKKVSAVDQFKAKQTADLEIVRTEDEQIRLSETEKKILKSLSRNAQIPFSQIAQKVGIATSTVVEKYKQLRKKRVLSFSVITINLEKLGYNAMAVILLKASPFSNASILHNQFLQIPNVIVAIKLIGPLDLLIVVPLKSLSDLLKLKDKIYRTSGVMNFYINIHSPYRKWPLNIFAPLLDKI